MGLHRADTKTVAIRELMRASKMVIDRLDVVMDNKGNDWEDEETAYVVDTLEQALDNLKIFVQVKGS